MQLIGYEIFIKNVYEITKFLITLKICNIEDIRDFVSSNLLKKLCSYYSNILHFVILISYMLVLVLE